MAPELRVVDRDEKPFYTVDSLAKKLGVTGRTVETMLTEGELPSYRFRGNRRIDPADVDSYLAAHREEGRAA